MAERIQLPIASNPYPNRQDCLLERIDAAATSGQVQDLGSPTFVNANGDSAKFRCVQAFCRSELRTWVLGECVEIPLDSVDIIRSNHPQGCFKQTDF